jgi:choline dehydrogenase-like flavoprotein
MLTQFSTKASVLLLESGGDNKDRELRISGDRYVTRFNPALNYNYKTVPQQDADKREIEYDRGTGLGGSTTINFGVWNIGPKDDHDEIARLTGDDEWKWENAKERYKRVENYHGFAPNVPPSMERYLNPKPEDHGHSGPINIGMSSTWEASVTSTMDLWASAGYKLRADLGDGTGLGFAIGPSTSHHGVRSTAADMVLKGPSNLQIVTDSSVAKVLFDSEKKAIGIQTLDGNVYHASKDIILSTGALDTPKILMHSGIGPRDQLTKFGISVLHENNAVGYAFTETKPRVRIVD